MPRTASKKPSDISLFDAVEDLMDGTDTARTETERTAKTVYLNGPKFAKFKELCASRGTSASKVLDRWIAKFLENVTTTTPKSPKR